MTKQGHKRQPHQHFFSQERIRTSLYFTARQMQRQPPLHLLHYMQQSANRRSYHQSRQSGSSPYSNSCIPGCRQFLSTRRPYSVPAPGLPPLIEKESSPENARRPPLIRTVSIFVLISKAASRVILLKMTISLLETHFPNPMNAARALRL